MNNFNQNYHYSQKQIDILLTQIQNQLQEQYQDLTVRWRTSKYNSRFRIKEPFRIDIGTKCISDNLHQGYVRDQDFVKVIFALNHEERHLQQRLLFQSTDVSDEIKQMARIDLIGVAIPEFYHGYGYYNDINEIDAELHGIIETRALFKENFPEIDVDQALTDIIKIPDEWYASKRFHTIDEAIQNLKTAKQESYHKYIPLPIKIAIPSKKSLALKTFMKSQDRIDTYWNFHDGMQANQFLLDFIAEEQPWRFYRYPCIRSEWPESALSGKAKPPTLASIRHLDRGSEAESRFEDILSHTESPDDSFSY